MISRTGGRSPHLVASLAAGRGPAVRAVILVRLDVDSHNTAELPRRLRSTAFPPGTVVRIDAGRARHYLDYFGEIGNLVRYCAEVEIVGTEPEGIDAVRDALIRALNSRESSAC